MMNGGRGGNRMRIVTDMDEVLTHITPEWVRRAKRESATLQAHFKLEQELREQDIYARDVYYLQDWLAREAELAPEAKKAFMELYQEPDFYEHCQPTRWAETLMLMTEQFYCEKIWVVTHTMPGMEMAKLRWLESHMPSGKVEIVCVPPSVPKSHAIVEVGAGDWTTFADDSPAVLVDVMDNTDSRGREVLVPMMGWNKNHKSVLEAAARNSAELIFYSPWVERTVPMAGR
jgi:5'(3')-deoxyribonucleotidase